MAGGVAVGSSFCQNSGAPPGSYLRFTTRLVGVLFGSQPSQPLFEWSWIDNFNGLSGGIARLNSDIQVDSGSGTGGILVTAIDGVPQTPPAVSCRATPDSLWPPNGKSVSVTISGSITAGTLDLDPNGSQYTVSDEYGQIHPTGNIAVSPLGTYSLTVPLIAERNGDDADGRTYAVNIRAKDTVGNEGSCSAVVKMPHDQR